MKKVFFKTKIDGEQFFFVNVNAKNKRSAIEAARIKVYEQTGKLPYSIFSATDGKEWRKEAMKTARQF